MLEGGSSQQPPARRALQEAFLDQERLDDVLDGVARLRQRGGHGIDADRPAAEALGDGREIAPVHGVEAGAVDFQFTQRTIGDGAVDGLVAVDMGEVAHAPQQPAGDARRAARAPRDFVGPVRRHANAEHARSAAILSTKLDAGGAAEIARRARGTPRIVNRLLRRVRDYAEVHGDGIVTGAIAHTALDNEGVDRRGLDRLDRRFLEAIIELYGGGPVGIDAVAATINDDAETLSEMVEPYLLKIGFIVRAPRGRRATMDAYTHLNRKPPAGATTAGQGALFE